MILAHKIALDPNNVQETYFRKAARTARFTFPASYCFCHSARVQL